MKGGEGNAIKLYSHRAVHTNKQFNAVSKNVRSIVKRMKNIVYKIKNVVTDIRSEALKIFMVEFSKFYKVHEFITNYSSPRSPFAR